jgi:hypothetical protein
LPFLEVQIPLPFGNKTPFCYLLKFPEPLPKGSRSLFRFPLFSPVFMRVKAPVLAFSTVWCLPLCAFGLLLLSPASVQQKAAAG